MKSEYKMFSTFVLSASMLSTVGCSSARDDSSASVAEKKAGRVTTTAERRVDQHTDSKVNRAIDRLFDKL